MSQKIKLNKREKKGCCAKRTTEKLLPIIKDDREECVQKITDLHPLSWEPLRSVFPLFGKLLCCLSNKAKEYTDKEKKELRKDIDE
jgi:DNA-directed RNA polymerase subunit F